MIPSVPVLYEGINERGLMGGQLYYREFAHFADKAIPGTLKIQPALCRIPRAVRHRRGGRRPVEE